VGSETKAMIKKIEAFCQAEKGKGGLEICLGGGGNKGPQCGGPKREKQMKSGRISERDIWVIVCMALPQRGKDIGKPWGGDCRVGRKQIIAGGLGFQSRITLLGTKI